MELKKILGFTTNSRNSFVSQARTGNIIYIAGCVVVLFNPQTRAQRYLISESKQTITTLAISDDGKYLATADCGQRATTIQVWNLVDPSDQEEPTPPPKIEATLVGGHTVEVSCMSFSTNNQVLVSIGGAQRDWTLNIWDWRGQVKLAQQKLSSKVRSISFSADSSRFVTVGETHVKYWYINNNNSSALGGAATDGGPILINCRSAILGNFKEGDFCDVKCGRRRRRRLRYENSSTTELEADEGEGPCKTFCITKQGLLCELIDERRLLHKWVDLRTASANCLAVGENFILVGCANGVVRCFSTEELRFLKNLPRPHQLATDIANKRQLAEAPTKSGSAANYPSLISVGLDESTKTISCVYNDRSIYVWDLGDELPTKVMSKKYSALYHSSCIWGIDVYPMTTTNQPTSRPHHQSSQIQMQLLARGSFVTCSSDDTLRVWSCCSSESVGGDSSSSSNELEQNIYKDNVFSNDLVKIFFTDSAHKFLCDLDCADQPDKARPDQQQQATNYDSNEGLRCLKLSPDGKHLAAGSRNGTIRVYDFLLDAELKSIAAHDAEVLCLEYSDPLKFDSHYYLASSSRDKLIHLFDAANGYKFLQTIDDHSSSITALRFVHNRTDDCLQLISCGTDQKIVFRKGQPASVGAGEARQQLNFVTERLIEGKTTFYDMEVDSESSCLMAACQDKMIRLFNVAQVRYQSAFKGSSRGSPEGATIIKLALDPSCTFLAASCTDKSVSIYDYQRGESVATVTRGLSDLVTDMKFSLDGRHLIGCSGNGCVYIWSSPPEVANASSSCLAPDRKPSVDYLDTTTANSDHCRPMLDMEAEPLTGSTEWNKAQDSCSDSPSLGDLVGSGGATTSREYQVQKLAAGSADSSELAGHTFGNDNNNNNNNNDEEHDNDDDQRTLRGGESSGNSPRSFANSQFHLDDDDSRSTSQRGARSRRNITSGGGVLKPRRPPAGAQVNHTAEYCQSRDNLDKISSRHKYIHDTLFSYNNSSTSRLRPTTATSLSGRFAGHSRPLELAPPEAGGQPKSRMSARAKSLSRMPSSSSSSTPEWRQPTTRVDSQPEGRADDLSGDDLSGDELSWAKDDGDDDDHSDNKPVKSATLNSGERRNKLCGGDGGAAHNPVARFRSSRSECNLAMKSVRRPDNRGANGDQVDLAELDPNRVPISRELCKRVVEQLEWTSGFASRLHGRLQGGGSDNSAELANYVSRGLRKSLDILSLVATAAPQQQFRSSQLDLLAAAAQLDAPATDRAGRGQWPTVAVSRKQASGGSTQMSGSRRAAAAATQAARRSSSIGSRHSSTAAAAANNNNNNVIGSAETVSPPAQISSGGSGSRSVAVSADHQGQAQVQQAGDRSSLHSHSSSAGSARHGGVDFVRSAAAAAAKVFEAQAQAAAATEGNGNNAAGQPNIDQVLEAYSDRLFKLVQRRMEWSGNNAAASSVLSRELASNSSSGQQTTKGDQENCNR